MELIVSFWIFVFGGVLATPLILITTHLEKKEKEKKQEKEAARNPADGILAFLEEIAKGETEHTISSDGKQKFSFGGYELSVHLSYDRNVYYCYLYHENRRGENLDFQLAKNGELHGFNDKNGFFPKEDVDRFVVACYALLAALNGKCGRATMEDIVRKRSEEFVRMVHASEDADDFADEDIRSLLHDIRKRLAYVLNNQKDMDVETQHEVERLENERLHQLIDSYRSLAVTQQEEHKAQFLHALTEIHHRITEMEAQVMREKQQDFQKIAYLVTNE